MDFCFEILRCQQVLVIKLQKTNIIRDYLEDINEIPKSRMFWPREIWSKYADKLEVHKIFSLFLLLLSSFTHGICSKTKLPHIQQYFMICVMCSTWLYIVAQILW